MNEYLSAQERLSVDKTTSPEPITTCNYFALLLLYNLELFS